MLLAAAPLHAAPSTPLLYVLGRSSLYCRGKRQLGGKASRYADEGAKKAGGGRKEEHELVGTLACRRGTYLAFDMMTKLSQKQ